jgi:peptidoglycan-associated lipoprotein
MYRVPRHTAFGVLLLAAVCIPATSALAQTPSNVRVVKRPARILRWLHVPSMDVLLEAEPGTTLEVLDKQGDWFWVIVPPDANGTRRAGWIRAGVVEAVIAPPPNPRQGQGDEAAPRASVSPAPSAPPMPNLAEDKVTVTETRGEPASARAPIAAKVYQFEDVHFDRDRYSLRSEDMEILRAAATALQADPSLVVNIEGHTCSLGTTEYNLALGLRRADAVKHYLESAGVAADRLHAVSLGEEKPKYDNSREETRRLNRRVVLAPNPRKPD